MGQTRAILCGYYGKGNGGDEALLASLLQMLPEWVTPVVLSGNPAETHQEYGVLSRDRFSAFQILQAMGQSDVLIWGGGSLIQDVTSMASPIYYCGLMGLAQKMGLKTIAWGQGIGPLKRPLTRWVAKECFSGCVAVSVRDRASGAILDKWGIPYREAPDPVWALDSIDMPQLCQLPEPRVAVNLRSHFTLTPERLANLTNALVDFQKATTTSILLVPFQASRDLSIAQSIASQLTGPHQIIQLRDPRKLKGLFREVEMVIGMRYHSLVMAAAEGCRCFALSYDPKVTSLMAELNLPGCDLADLPNQSSAIVQAWLEEYAHSHPLTKDKIQSLVNRALIHRDLLTDALKEVKK